MDEKPVQHDDTFLEEARHVYPNVTQLLNAVQLLALKMEPMEPFSKGSENEQFLKLAEAYFVTKHSIDHAREALRVALLHPQTKGKEVDTHEEKLVIQCLDLVQRRLKTTWDRKLKTTESIHGEIGLPRIIRLCRKLELSSKETLIMIYILICQVGETKTTKTPFGFQARTLYGSSTLSICKACDVMISEVVNFLNADRVHMQQGIFPDIQQNHLLHSDLDFDQVSCKVLIGAPLKQNEFLMIDQSCLAEVLIEEVGNEHLKVDELVSPGGEGKKEEEAGQSKVAEGPQVMLREATKVVEEDEVAPIGDGEKREEAKETHDLDYILRQGREREKKHAEKTAILKSQTSDADLTSDELTPYNSDLEYLDDHFQLIAQKRKVKMIESRMEMEADHEFEMMPTREPHRLKQKKEAQRRYKVLQKKCEKRLTLTQETGKWMPRLERLAKSLCLQPFEKNVLLTLISSVIQPSKLHSSNTLSVGEILRLFSDTLQEQIQYRMYFYKSATIVRVGMIIVDDTGVTGDHANAKVEIDRRMLDFCVGLDTEFSEIVEGSHLYFPKTQLEQVILREGQKELILKTVSNFEGYKRCRRKMGLDDAITYGAGMVMLFHGAPGTGKTMMANALANYQKKKILLVNYPSLDGMSAGQSIKLIFNAAKINDAILFLDECDTVFESKEKGSHDMKMFLTEIERHDGRIIMATNRPYDLDEAMHRRIMIAIEFCQPDHLLRKTIWESHIPEQMNLADDIDLGELSMHFELSGGFIKNAILSALSIAVSRDGEKNPVVCQEDLRQGANLQLRGALRMKEFPRRVVPSSGLESVVVEESLKDTLKEIVKLEKARSTLFGEWEFDISEQQGVSVLFYGASGTGKTHAAQALGYEVGKPLKMFNCGELLSKWMAESTKNINAIFEEARHSDAILVFDEAERLFGYGTSVSTSTDHYANVDVGVLLYHIERFPGIIILTTNLIDNIDKAFVRRLDNVLHFENPSADIRKKLWRLLIPKKPHCSGEMDFQILAAYEITGGSIKSCIFRAACRTALEQEKRQLTMGDLEKAVKEEVKKISITSEN